MLAIIDYNAGNLTSVKRALDFLTIPCRITANPKDFKSAQGVIFPGVGAAGSAMTHLSLKGLDCMIREIVSSGKPLLGICLGCQIILDSSEENDVVTLGVLPGHCRRFDPGLTEENGCPISIPHMGWNTVTPKKQIPLLRGIAPEAEFYFVHSYFPDPSPEFVLGTTYYGQTFPSIIGRNGLWATQFHPEKSGRPGLKVLKNFYAYCLEGDSLC